MDNKSDDTMLKHLHKTNQQKGHKIRDYARNIRDNAKYFAMAGVFLAAAAVTALKVYDMDIRKDSVEFKNFPKNVKSIDEVNIPSKYHEGKVIDQIVYVERTRPDSEYAIKKINDSTEIIIGELKYSVRDGSSMEGGYGLDIRYGEVKATIDNKVNSN